LLDERHRVALGISDGREGRPAGNIEALDDNRCAELGRLHQRRSQVPHLDIERHPAPVTLAEVPARPRLRSPDARLYLHYWAVTDVPVEQGGVEGPLRLRIDGLDLPVHHGPRPVVAHAGLLMSGRAQATHLAGVSVVELAT